MTYQQGLAALPVELIQMISTSLPATKLIMFRAGCGPLARKSQSDFCSSPQKVVP